MQDRPYFQVTSPVLQRLQDVLRHLMAQGKGGLGGPCVRQHCLVALRLSGVLLAQGPGWAEEGSSRFWEEQGQTQAMGQRVRTPGWSPVRVPPGPQASSMSHSPLPWQGSRGRTASPSM